MSNEDSKSINTFDSVWPVIRFISLREAVDILGYVEGHDSKQKSIDLQFISNGGGGGAVKIGMHCPPCDDRYMFRVLTTEICLRKVFKVATIPGRYSVMGSPSRRRRRCRRPRGGGGVGYARRRER